MHTEQLLAINNEQIKDFADLNGCPQHQVTPRGIQLAKPCENAGKTWVKIQASCCSVLYAAQYLLYFQT